MKRGRIRIALAIICGLISPICMASQSIPTAAFGVVLLTATAYFLESIRREQLYCLECE